ncbi:MAG TPA: DUF6457 domain-containing protein [Actinomycetota bacterium]
MDQWVSEVCAALGLDDDVDTDAILELARDVAHGVERRAAPVTTFLVGLAAGRAGGGRAAEESALATVKEVAGRWSPAG